MGCATNLVRYLFFAFNFIFWILGIVVFAIGIYSRVENDTWKDLIDADTLFAAANLLIAAGVIVAAIGFFGCCGAIKKYNWMLIAYCILVILIFILEVAAGGYAYSNQEMVENKLVKGMNKAVAYNYGKDDTASIGMTKALDWFQQKLECCGVNGSYNWESSAWFEVNNKTIVPESCCRKKAAGCNAVLVDGYNDAKIFTKGCVKEGKKFAKDNIYLIGGVGVGIAIVELLAIVFAVCLICSFKNEEKGTTA